MIFQIRENVAYNSSLHKDFFICLFKTIQNPLMKKYICVYMYVYNLTVRFLHRDILERHRKHWGSGWNMYFSKIMKSLTLRLNQ